MAGPSLLCCLFLLLGGVFGDTDEVTVSVMKGDSVTLHIKPEETQRSVKLLWTFNSEETAIATLDKELKNEIKYNDDARFKDRLQLDVVSGSLNITNIRTTDSGVYTLKIIRLNEDSISKRFRVTVSDEVTVSVMEGDSVTLHIKPEETQRTDRLWWTFNSEETAIVILDKETSKIRYNDDTRFKDRLQLDAVSGSLTIRDIRTTDSGVYTLKISRISGNSVFKTFRVTVSEVITVSVGDSVTLQTDVKIQTDDVIQWKFKGDIIADLTGPVNERVRNSEVKPQTGDLIITDIRGDQFGDYELKINSRGLIISHRRFSVSVREKEKSASVSSWAVAAICFFVLLVIAAVGVILYRHYQKKRQEPRNNGENKDANEVDALQNSKPEQGDDL